MSARVNRDRVSEAWRLHQEGKLQQDIADTLGVGLRTVQNYLSIEWLRERGLEHLRLPAPTEQAPATPLQLEGFTRHQRGDHSWLQDDQLKGHVFASQTVDGPDTKDVWIVPPGDVYYIKPDLPKVRIQHVPIPREVRKCPWCDYRIKRVTNPLFDEHMDVLERVLGGEAKWTEDKGPGF